MLFDLMAGAMARGVDSESALREANALCGDLEIHRQLPGSARPHRASVYAHQHGIDLNPTPWAKMTSTSYRSLDFMWC